MDVLLESFKEVGTTTVFLVVLLITCVFYWMSGHHGRRLPPGPMGLPVVGYLPFLTRKPHLKLGELTKKYGPIFSMYIGSRYVIILGDLQSIRAAFIQDAFMGRPPDTPFDLNKETVVVQATNGPKWREQRNFSVQILRDLGLGKSSMEEHIRSEISYVLEQIEKTRGQPFNISVLLAPSMSNNISSLVFGRRMEFDDPKRIMLNGILKDVSQLAGQVGFHTFFPWLKKLLKFLRFSKYDRLSKSLTRMKHFVADEIKDHEKTLDASNIRDYIDGYLLEIEKRKADPNTTFRKSVLQDLVGGFFGAGSETVKTTVEWLMLIMAAFQDVQKKVQDEIKEAIGLEKFPVWTDHKQLPYTQAVIMELMRWRTIVPINILRYTIEDTRLNSFDIPKHACVIANLWGVHHDPDQWDDPDTFKPERFLTEDGKGINKPDHFIPFSIGKRACPGESLANMEVFLYFASIMQKFHVKLPEGAKPDLEGRLGLSLQVQPYELCAELRT